MVGFEEGAVGSFRHFDVGRWEFGFQDRPDRRGFVSPFVLRSEQPRVGDPGRNGEAVLVRVDLAQAAVASFRTPLFNTHPSALIISQ